MDAKTQDVRAEIDARLDSWTEAVKNKDTDAIVAHYLPDVVAFDAVQALQFKGAQAYGEHWKKCMEMCSGSSIFEARQRDICVDGDLAVAHALVYCGMVDDEGKEQAGWARMTTSLRRVDGQWLIIHEHFSVPFDMITGRVLCGLSPDAEDAHKPRTIPDGMNTITPHLVCKNAAEAIAFYKKAFDAAEESRMALPDGVIVHACLRIGGSPLFLMEDVPAWNATSPGTLGGTPVSMHLYVSDVDEAFARAIAAGATSIMAVDDTFWGDRYGVIEDPFGHRWSLATHVRDLSPEEIQRGAMAAFDAGDSCPASAQP